MCFLVCYTLMSLQLQKPDGFPFSHILQLLIGLSSRRKFFFCLDDLGPLACFLSELIWNYGSYRQSVGLRLLRRVISPSQCRYLHKTAQTQKKRRQTDIQVSCRIRTHDSSLWAGERISCLRPCGHCDRLEKKVSARKCYFRARNLGVCHRVTNI
jgi:hypothetical protein